MHTKIHYTVDGKSEVTEYSEMTPIQILERAGENHDERFLVEIEGERRESYHDRPHDEIHMHDGQVFETSERTVHFEVDDEVCSTRQHDLTPVEIMRLGGVDPENHYLVRVEGHHQHSYKDDPNTPTHIPQNAKFITLMIGPTPVS